jgi:hypothetical protein
MRRNQIRIRNIMDGKRKESKMPDATMLECMRFFDIPIATFRKEWAELSDTDKAQIKKGIGDGSFAY